MRVLTLANLQYAAISAGAALAFTSPVLEAGGQTTRIDNGKEYYPSIHRPEEAIYQQLIGLIS